MHTLILKMLCFMSPAFFKQDFDPHDIVVIGLLVVLEGVLSIDNALVLGLLARRLPKRLQGRALTYGLVGAFIFRLIAIGAASWLLHWRVVKLLGGGYLVYIAIKHLFFGGSSEDHLSVDADGHPELVDAEGKRVSREEEGKHLASRTSLPLPDPAGTPVPSASVDISSKLFWSTVMVIELTDIAFAIDSILAAIALVGAAPSGHTGTHPKLWVVLTGGMLGVILMRFAAVMFIKLLERFPRFELSAYLLVIVIGAKLLADWGLNSEAHPHRADFHSPSSPAFWIFWIAMLICFLVGFIPKRQKQD